VESALRLLTEHRLLVEGPPGPEHDPAAAAAGFVAAATGSRTPAAIADALRRARVAVVGSGALAADAARALRAGGIGVIADVAAPVDLVVAAPAAAESGVLVGWNRAALARGVSWLQVLPFDGRYACVGPLYLPGETCCFECFRRRRRANLDVGDELDLLETIPATYPAAPFMSALVAAVAVTTALRWLVVGDHGAPSAFYAVELGDDLAVSRHHVHRVPRCPACSGLADAAAPLPWFKEHAPADC